ncbi:MAG: hypothetical protein WKH64_15125 [Chloroflexia bacterium]
MQNLNSGVAGTTARPEDLTAAGTASSGGDTSVLVQPTLNDLSSLTAAEQTAYLDTLNTVLRARQAELQRDTAALTDEIGNLRGQFDQIGAERDRLVSNRNRDRTLFDNLNNIIRQQQVGSSIQSDKVEVIGRSVQAEKTGPTGVTPVILGGLVGLLLGVIAAFLSEFVGGQRGGLPSLSSRRRRSPEQV